MSAGNLASRPEAADRPGSLWGPLSHIGALAALAVFLADQGLKLWLLYAFDLGARDTVAVAPVMDLVLVWNRGISYGLFAQHTELGRWLLVAVKLGASVLFWVWLARTRSLLAGVSLGLLIGGALGNALDRVLHGAVVDFIHVHFFGTDFFQYVFNLADVAVTVGVVGLLYDAVRAGHRAA